MRHQRSFTIRELREVADGLREILAAVEAGSLTRQTGRIIGMALSNAVTAGAADEGQAFAGVFRVLALVVAVVTPVVRVVVRRWRVGGATSPAPVPAGS